MFSQTRGHSAKKPRNKVQIPEKLTTFDHFCLWNTICWSISVMGNIWFDSDSKLGTFSEMFSQTKGHSAKESRNKAQIPEKFTTFDHFCVWNTICWSIFELCRYFFQFLSWNFVPPNGVIRWAIANNLLQHYLKQGVHWVTARQKTKQNKQTNKQNKTKQNKKQNKKKKKKKWVNVVNHPCRQSFLESATLITTTGVLHSYGISTHEKCKFSHHIFFYLFQFCLFVRAKHYFRAWICKFTPCIVKSTSIYKKANNIWNSLEKLLIHIKWQPR